MEINKAAIEAMEKVPVIVKLLPEESVIGNYCTIERDSLRKLIEAALPHLNISIAASKEEIELAFRNAKNGVAVLQHRIDKTQEKIDRILATTSHPLDLYAGMFEEIGAILAGEAG